MRVNISNWGMLGPAWSQAQHTTSLWNWVTGVAPNQVSSSGNKALSLFLRPSLHLEAGSVWRTSVMCLWLSFGFCKPRVSRMRGTVLLLPSWALWLCFWALIISTAHPVCLPGSLSLLLFSFLYDPSTGQSTLTTLCWISFRWSN